MGLWSKQSLQDIKISEEDSSRELHRTLKTKDLILLGIGAIVGAGLFSITGIAAAENAGPAILISFIIAAICCTFAGLCYGELAGMFPVSGSAYTYTYATMGEFPAWVIGWTLILEYAIGAATVAVSWSGYAASVLQGFDIHFPNYLMASPWQDLIGANDVTTTGIINLPALTIVFGISMLLITGIRQSAIVNSLIVMIKLGAVAVFIAVGAFYINPENYHPFIPENTGVFGEFGWSGIFRAAGVVFFAYIGFDSVSTTALETKNPQKSIPRAILSSLFICTLIYIVFTTVLIGLANYKDLDVSAPVVLAIANTPYPWLQGVIKLAIIAGLTSVILVYLLGQSRIFLTMASDGLLPKRFAKIHPRFRTPWHSNLILMVLVGGIAAFVPISVLGHLVSIGTLLTFAFVCMEVLVLRYIHPEYPRPFRVPFFPAVPILGVLTCLGMMSFLGIESWIRLVVWLLIGMIIYFAYSRHHSRLANR